MAEPIELNASKREITGKQVKQLRRQGLVPAVLYGPSREPLSLQVEERVLAATLAWAGGSHIITLNIDGQSFQALVREVQRDNIHDNPLHVDFYAVSMDRLVRTEIPLDFIGEPTLVASKEAILVTGTTFVEVESLPGNLPPSIPVDLSDLVDMDSAVTVGDLHAPTGVTFLTEAGEVVARLDYAAMAEEAEEEEEEVVEMDAEAVEVIHKGKAEEEGVE
jgi:large subunit ribosomal protein L25